MNKDKLIEILLAQIEMLELVEEQHNRMSALYISNIKNLVNIIGELE